MSPEIKLGNPDTQAPEIRHARGKCASCAVYENCLFHMPRYGGFRNLGKRYVAYALITDPTENSNGKEDISLCDHFVGGGLQDRMISGQIAAAEGRRDAEIVRILIDKQVGDTVSAGVDMGYNGRGEIIKPDPNLVEDLIASGHKVNLDDRTAAVEYKTVMFNRTIPDYNKPKITRGAYSEQIRAREAELNRSEIEDEASRFEERFADMEAQHGKRRGRPPGSRNKPKDEEESDLA